VSYATVIGDPPPADDDDPMMGLDPWTAAHIRMRKFVESGSRTMAEVEELALEIRATLPEPAPPPEVDAVIRADLALLELNPLGGTPLTGPKLWTPPPEE